MRNQSMRSRVVTRRTYNRPIDSEGKTFETWPETVSRVMDHQQWLWERSLGRELSVDEMLELDELQDLMLEHKVSTSGRTLWLGGTDVAKKREASQFNCAFLNVETVYDVVDSLWLLLQGCGVGFSPVIGTLTGFLKPIPEIEVVRTERTTKGGAEGNQEFVEDDVWTIKVGDSAKAWAKSIGKIMAGKHNVRKLVLDFSEIRPAGERLAGYGWISSGDEQIAEAYTKIAEILNQKAGQLLTRMDILDIENLLGTVLSSRRSAEIAIFPVDEPEWEEFAIAKKDFWLYNNEHRTQSNNSLLFKKKPLREDLEHIFGLMRDAGGSEPGFINGEEALRRAPWFKGCNPCVEILLGNKSFCNLTEVDVAKFKGDTVGLLRALRISARANYRQTCVDLRDGILQESWHLNNFHLRLCGVGLTGIAKRPELTAYDYKDMERNATYAAYSMADELDTPRPKNVTCVKPSGTLSKVMDTTEGVHKPLGRYIFNNINFSKHDPLIPKLEAAGYNVFPHPFDAANMIVTMPVEYHGVDFDKVDGKEVNLETAVDQLERYRLLNENWTQQNTSVTISYDPEEVPEIISWLLRNWDSYVGVSFLYRTDPTKTAADLGYPYLPQEVVTKEKYEAYVAQLSPVDVEDDENNTFDEISNDECATGACPIK